MILTLTLCCILVTMEHVWKYFEFKIRRDNQKNSYERRVNESVDNGSLSLALNYLKNMSRILKKQIQLMDTIYIKYLLDKLGYQYINSLFTMCT